MREVKMHDDVIVRTTLTIEERIARDLKLMAHRSEKLPRRYRVPAVSLGSVRRGVDLDKALALADSLEDEELVHKLELRK